MARLGGGDLAAAQQRMQERQAAGAQASTSGQDGGGWGDRAGGLGGMRAAGAGGSGQIELPAMPWSDWEVPAEQITICKRDDGSDWELGSGAFGKVCLGFTSIPTPDTPSVLHPKIALPGCCWTPPIGYVL